MRLALLLLLAFALPARAARVKDVASVYGSRDNVLFGYGLVTGLGRTGDSRRNEATIRALANRLQGLGFTLATDEIVSRNVAVVMVTARLPSGARPGHRIDADVSSTGDATSLEGGVLQVTPLYATNGEAFATAQGSVVLGGFVADEKGASAKKNHATAGSVPQGATVERENPNRLDLAEAAQVEWLVRDPDFTTATRMAAAINGAIEGAAAFARDEGTVVVPVPSAWTGKVVDLVATVEAVDVEVDLPARVVINERTGTVVMGADVRIAAVAVAHGGLSIEVRRDTRVSQPAPLSLGTTKTATETGIRVEESGGGLSVVDGVTIGDLVDALNAIGVKPRDLIQILVTIRAAGALQAELEVI